MDRHSTVRHSPRVAARKLTAGTGAVVLNLDTAAYHELNEVGALIWELIEGGVTLEALLGSLRSRLDDRPPNLEQEVSDFLGQMAERGLIQIEGGSSGQL